MKRMSLPNVPDMDNRDSNRFGKTIKKCLDGRSLLLCPIGNNGKELADVYFDELLYIHRVNYRKRFDLKSGPYYQTGDGKSIYRLIATPSSELEELFEPDDVVMGLDDISNTGRMLAGFYRWALMDLGARHVLLVADRDASGITNVCRAREACALGPNAFIKTTIPPLYEELKAAGSIPDGDDILGEEIIPQMVTRRGVIGTVAAAIAAFFGSKNEDELRTYYRRLGE